MKTLIRYDEKGDFIPKNKKRKDVPPEVSAYFAALNRKRGFCTWSRAKRSAVAKMTAQKRWATRRRRYGQQGYRIRAKKKTAKEIREMLIIQCPDLIDHPVWRQS